MEEAGEEELIPEGFIVEADDAPLLPEEAEAVNLAGEELGDFGLSGEGEDLSLDEPGGSEILPFPGTEQSGESAAAADLNGVSPVLTQELRTVLSYMDHLLESLPQDKIEEFAQSEYFDTYKKLFKELGLE
jgi:hypothetical protein